jgi:hypothetical protein
MAGYVSELTRFIDGLRQAKPDLERRQRAARALWWDRPLDADEERRFEASRVPQRAYVYQTTTNG